MGPCFSSKTRSTRGISFDYLQHFVDYEKDTWCKIRDFNLDYSASFSFLLEIQDNYVHPDGSFILQDSIQHLVLEFKRFLFLLVTSNRTLIHPLNVAPSPLIDRFWRTFITSSDVYKLFRRETSAFENQLSRSSTRFWNLNDYDSTK